MGEKISKPLYGVDMADITLLFFSATTSFIFLCVGIVAGWTAKDFVHDYMWSKDDFEASHPEMYDQQGNWLNEELLHVKFINEEDDDETLDA